MVETVCSKCRAVEKLLASCSTICQQKGRRRLRAPERQILNFETGFDIIEDADIRRRGAGRARGFFSKLRAAMDQECWYL